MQTQSKQLDFSGQNFYCGIDTHQKTWTVTIQTDVILLKTFTQNPEPMILSNYLRKHYPGGNYIAGYEAGYFGYGIQRDFESLGIKCFVLHAADVPTSQKDKEQKRDPRDSRKIAKALKNNEVVPIWVPPLSLEQDRQLLRTREKLTTDYTRIKNRIKAALQFNGIKYPEAFNVKGSHWSWKFIQWLNNLELNEPTATEAMRSRVRYIIFLRGELLTTLQQIRKLSKNVRYSKVYSEFLFRKDD